ncbi:MAG: SH3 domain-containing protein [bacterium]|nr:SH3 domain-containing protein [bacterium]
MRFKYPLLCTILLCLSSIFISNAQPETWRAWLYSDSSGEMTQIDATGSIRASLILPKPTGYESYTYPYFVAVAPTGDRVAYALTGANGESVLAVYHLINNAMIVTYPLPTPAQGALAGTSLNYSPQPEVFSADGRFLAMSYYIDQNWTLMVLDTQNSGSLLVQSITSASPNVPVTTGVYELPVPVFFDFNIVHVVMAPIAGDGGLELVGYEWDYLTNTMTYSNAFRTIEHDIEPRTGEVIYAFRDYNFTDRTDEIIGIGVHQNTVQVYSPVLQDTAAPFYVDTTNIIDYAYFIQNGERILLRTSDITGATFGTYTVIDRVGAWQGTLPYQGVWAYAIFGTSDGFVFTISTSELATYFPFVQNANSTAVVFVDTKNFGITNNFGNVIYTDANGTNPRLVWVKDMTPSIPPNPTTWSILNPTVANNSPQQPVVAVNPTQPPVNTPVGNTISPTPTSGIVVGGMARVTNQTTGLNVRSSANTGGAKVAELKPGDVVSVIGGPQYAQGYTWWQISMGGITGWVAAGTGNQVWLEPFTGSTTLPPPPPPVVTPDEVYAPVLYDPYPGQVFLYNDLNSGGSIIPIGFEWETLPNITIYYLEIEKCADVCTFIYGYYESFSAHFFDVTTYGFGTYRWRVTAVDEASVEGPPSEWRFFSYNP